MPPVAMGTSCLQCLILCFILLSLAQAAEQTPDAGGSGRQGGDEERRLHHHHHRPVTEAEQPLCSNSDDGVCIPPSNDKINKIIHSNNEDEAITILAQTYASSEYGYKIMREVRKIQKNAPLLEQFERQRVEIMKSKESGIDDHIRRTIFHISDFLLEELLTLALVHREEWTQIALEESALELEVGNLPNDDDDDAHYANDHFDKAVNAYEALLLVYQRLWFVVEQDWFSHADQETLSSGQTNVYLLLADMFHERSNTRHDYVASDDSYVAYRYLIRAESWFEKTSLIIGNTSDGDGSEEPRFDQTTTLEAKQTMAFIQVQMGTLLVDMYAFGYELGNDLSTFTKPEGYKGYGEVESRTQLTDGQKQILDLSLRKLQRGFAIYASVEKEEGAHAYPNTDIQLNVAQSSDTMGTVYRYLFKWDAAASEFQGSLDIYDKLFKAYYESGMVLESVEMASSMVATTQSLFEAYLYLPRRTDDAKKVFKRHLILRRYFESQTPMRQSLTDEEEEQDADYYGTNGSYEINDPQHEETLKTYQNLLNEYLQMQSEYPPDGSYYEMGFDYIDSNPSYVQHDKVYEGSLRSGIGSLQLSLNKLWEAKSELEMAVSLLSNGVDGEYDSYGENGEIIDYPVKLELANALLNLAYVLLGLRQWRSSFEAFEEAMDLYASELTEGGSPMDHPDSVIEVKNGNLANLGERLASFIKGGMGWEEETPILDEDSSDGKGLKEGTRYISLDDYQMVQNVTIS
mmetsp:Transcript_14322/g.30609  ORF Transcript_14322/g.30609 Transcript_14322/m.30609 type:complete len:745 (-) Transcript_14322:45-2279(-)